MKEIRACLHAEGYSQNVVVGRHLLAQLQQLMLDADPASYGMGSKATTCWMRNSRPGGQS
jgi:hypothetical protein